jgi:hypothetical protein
VAAPVPTARQDPAGIKMDNGYRTLVTFDPILYTAMLALINVETTVTVRFPDTSTLAFYGFLKSFTPGEFVEGEPPTVDLEVVPTNQDPTSGDEEAPVLTNVPGT